MWVNCEIRGRRPRISFEGGEEKSFDAIMILYAYAICLTPTLRLPYACQTIFLKNLVKKRCKIQKLIIVNKNTVKLSFAFQIESSFLYSSDLSHHYLTLISYWRIYVNSGD